MDRNRSLYNDLFYAFFSVPLHLAMGLLMSVATMNNAVAAAAPGDPPPGPPLPVPATGSWYVSSNTTASNWSKTGLFYEKAWQDRVDCIAGGNTTLELYVKALTPRTIELFNGKKLSLGVFTHPDATHPTEAGGVALGDYATLVDQNWTKVSIPLSAFKGLNFSEVIYFPGTPQSLGTGEYSLGIDEIRFVGGPHPVLFYGDAHPNNPITIHGAGMEAHYLTTGGVDLGAPAPAAAAAPATRVSAATPVDGGK
jgi:hypothetical protein